MEKTNEALEQILKILEEQQRQRDDNGLKKIVMSSIISAMATLIVAVLLGLFSWGSGVGHSTAKIREDIKEMNIRISTLVKDVNFNFRTIQDKLHIPVTEIK